jgi:hypothetical protein
MIRRLSCFIGLFLSTPLFLPAGCGGTPAPGTSPPVTGTIRGQTFTLGDQISAVISGKDGNGAGIELYSTPGVCADISAGRALQSTQAIVISVAVKDAAQGTTGPSGPGTFPVVGPSSTPPSGPLASVLFVNVGADCSQTIVASGASGSVTLTSVDGAAFAGSADVTFDSGDHLAFEFSTTACAAIGSPPGASGSCP